LFHFNLKVKTQNSLILPHPKLLQSFDLSERKGVFGNPEAELRGILLIKDVKIKGDINLVVDLFIKYWETKPQI